MLSCKSLLVTQPGSISCGMASTLWTAASAAHAATYGRGKVALPQVAAEHETAPTSQALRLRAQVEMMPVYYPNAEEARNPRLYADNVRHLMARALGAQLCEHGLTTHARLKRAGIAVDWTGR